MFERMWLTGSSLGGRRFSKFALMAVASSGVWAANEKFADAQLRSGRVERPLYHHQLEQQSQESDAASEQKLYSRSVVARPSRSTPSRLVRSQQSIVEPPASDGKAANDSPNEPSANAQSKRQSDDVARDRNSQSESMYGDAEPMMESGSHEYYGDEVSTIDNGGGGCSCGQCRGQDYRAQLAPGCCQSGYGFALGVDACDSPLGRLLSRSSLRAEVPLFWRRAIGVPSLVTTAPIGTPSTTAGQLGQPTTTTLFGNSTLGEDLKAGVRLNFSTWFDDCCYRGLQVRYMNAGRQTTEFNTDSNTTPILARPFNNISTGTSSPDTQLIAYPGQSTGTVQVRTTSEVDGIDVVMKRLAYRDRFTRVDWLIGYQHNRIEEQLQIRSNTTVAGNVPPLAGSSIAVTDLLRTSNNFHGGVIGLMSSRQFAYWRFESMGRLGLGNMARRIDNTGATTTTSATGVTATDAQGLLVRDTNNRPFKDNSFVFAPELGFNAGYWLTSNLDFSVGYNYLYLPQVAQVGRQIDSTVNLNDPLTGVLRPQIALDRHGYWLHSLNLGLQWRY